MNMLTHWRVWRRLGLIAILVLLGGQALHAQSVTVQSGEHPTFTRLVLDIGEGRSWEVIRTSPEEAQITFRPAVEAFDLTGVFDLIPRTRLSALAQGDGLDLQLACNCGLSTERFRDRYLIVDITDAAGAAAEPELAAATDQDAARRVAASEALPDLGRLLLDGTTTPVEAQVDVRPEAPEAPSVALEEAAAIMAEQLARAAASGLLDAAPGQPLGRNAEIMAEPATPQDLADAPIQDTPPTGAVEVFPPADSAPLRAQTAFDTAVQTPVAERQLSIPAQCGPDRPPIADWASGEGLSHGLGQLRMAIYDENDVFDPAAAQALAQHYLSYGFGAEAAFWLTRMPSPPADLLRLASLMDGASVEVSNAPIDPELCRDEALLWMYASQAPGLPLSQDVARQVQRATASLPPELRDHMAPRIARQLYRDGFPNAARNLRDMLARGGRVPANTLLALDLDLGLTEGQGATRDAIALALRDDGADPVGMMAHALAFDRATDHAISDVRLTAAEALLREEGLHTETAPLWQEVVLAHAARSDMRRVLTHLEDDGIPSSIRNQTLTMLIMARLAAEDTAAIYVLARLYGPGWQSEGSEAGRARVAAIAHLRAAGLTYAAEQLRVGQRTLILPARPLPEPSAEADIRAAWHSSNWAELAERPVGLHSAIAARLQTQAEPDQALALTEMGATLADTRALRQEVEALLATPTPTLIADTE